MKTLTPTERKKMLNIVKRKYGIDQEYNYINSLEDNKFQEFFEIILGKSLKGSK